MALPRSENPDPHNPPPFPPQPPILGHAQSFSDFLQSLFSKRFTGKVVLHFLPPYCPNDRRIERVWLDLHANVTRNHRCKSIEELMAHVFAFLRAYNRRSKLNPSLNLATGVSESRSVV